jgi:hypothetical protein
MKVAIVANGPSLRRVQIPRMPGVLVIAVNGAIEWCDAADWFFSLDPSRYVRGLVNRPRPGVRYFMAVPEDYGTPSAKSPAHRVTRLSHVTYLRRVTGNGVRGSRLGLSEDPAAISTGNSAYGALGLAYHQRPEKIALFGVDATARGYAYAPGRPRWSLAHLPELFASALPQLRGIEVINGSPRSLVNCFPRVTPEEALAWLAEPDEINEVPG